MTTISIKSLNSILSTCPDDGLIMTNDNTCNTIGDLKNAIDGMPEDYNIDTTLTGIIDIIKLKRDKENLENLESIELVI